ncbi:histone deacetylase family protein [Amycolatopsis sp. NBC_00345]|uniref:histone deacetylase family protein n=1 Tax=Amycolatopsis sp. NBC_00345 TaxID=2975955 RepID=UPI002E273ACF
MHDPPYQVDDGQLVPVLDLPIRVARLLEGAMGAGAELVEPDPAPGDSLLAVHDPEMIRYFETAHPRWSADGRTGPVVPDSFGPRRGGRRPEPGADVRAEAGYFCRDTATPIIETTWRAAQWAAASAITAARLVTEGTNWAYALCRPPGHHAARGEYSGFCYLNNAALAASGLRAHGRVAILDIDFHHGNGTQELFWEAPDVFYASLHGSPRRHFPFYCGYADERGADSCRGTVLNVPLPDGTDGKRYLGELHDVVARIAEFGASHLVISLGLDIARDDPVGTFELGNDDLYQVGAAAGQLGLPTVITQEGGYDVPGLGDQLRAFLLGLCSS